jgi:serine protease Do
VSLLSSAFGLWPVFVLASAVSDLSQFPATQLISNARSEFSPPAIFPAQYAPGRLLADVPVPEIARQVSVRIVSEKDAGSGAIVQRRGQTYTVLTCAHVLAYSQKSSYTVLTADGSSHTATRLSSIHFGDADLALLEFTSNRSYQVAELGNSNSLSVGEQVYAAGFPNSESVNLDGDVGDWGLRTYRLTNGQVGMVLQGTLDRGYQLGYTNEIEEGMSGGPILDSRGRLIGINGRLKYSLAGIDAYSFEDGSVPSLAQFQQMEALSWAVPISTFQEMAEQWLGL